MISLVTAFVSVSWGGKIQLKFHKFWKRLLCLSVIHIQLSDVQDLTLFFKKIYVHVYQIFKV